jgi:hypothetical protein
MELATLGIFQPQLVIEFATMGVEVIDKGALARLSNLVVGSRLLVWIKAIQLGDSECTKIKQLLRNKAFTLRMLGCSPMSVCQKMKD